MRAELKQAIETVVRSRFPSIDIRHVLVEEGEDHDGDPVLFVKIVFDAPLEHLDPARLSGITRHIRSRLAELNEDRFPHSRFISLSDYEAAVA